MQTCLRAANGAKSQLARGGHHGCSGNTEVASGWLESYGVRTWPVTLVLVQWAYGSVRCHVNLPIQKYSQPWILKGVGSSSIVSCL